MPALLLALILAMPALAQDLASDLGGGLTATHPDANHAAGQVDMENADVVIGYIDSGMPILNPANCTNWNMISINQLVFEPTVDLDDSMKPTPMLADSWTQDGKTWTFTMRSGIQFHNGYELTAYDVVRSYETLLMAGETNPYYARLQMISSMQATDVYTLQVEGKTASYMTLYAMVFPVMQYQTLADEMPRGTGPYWYIRYDENGTVRLEANPLWWKRQPAVQSILLRHFTESGDAIEAIQTHQIDMLATKSAKAAFSRKLSNLTSLDFPSMTYEMLVPNLADTSLLSDVNVRQAVMYAIDRSVIASNAYKDMAIQSEVPIPPNSWLYESQSAIYYYSPERALQLMYDSGWRDLTGNGLLNKQAGIMLQEATIRLITYNEPTNSMREKAAYLIADYLKAVGFNVSVTVRSRERALENIKSHDYELALVGVNLSEVPDITPILESGGSLNLNRYSSENTDTLIERIRTTSDENTLKQLYSEMQMTVVNRLPILGLLFRTGAVLSTRSIGGLGGMRAYDAFNGFEFLK